MKLGVKSMKVKYIVRESFLIIINVYFIIIFSDF